MKSRSFLARPVSQNSLESACYNESNQRATIEREVAALKLDRMSLPPQNWGGMRGEE